MIGLALIITAVAIFYASTRGGIWAAYALSADTKAAEIFAILLVSAEFLAMILPTASQLYSRMGEGWLASQGWLMTVVVVVALAFSAGAFVLTSVSDRTGQREQELAKTPAVKEAKDALEDAKAARDKECTDKNGKPAVGMNCRKREDAVTDHQNKLDAATDKAESAAILHADPVAAALHVSSTTLKSWWAAILVLICMLTGQLLKYGWGLVFVGRRR